MDSILRAMAGNGSMRIFVADTKELAEKAFEIHNTTPVMTAALGRALTAAAIMGCMLKNEDDLLTLSFKGDGPGRGLIVTGDSKANVKGYCFENYVDIPLKPSGKLDVHTAIGNGTLTVIKDMGLKEPYVGRIKLVSGEIAEDLAYYFMKSEQTASAVALGVLVDKDYSVKYSGGYIIQLMPDIKPEIIDALEKKLDSLPPITKMFDDGMKIEDILNEIAGEFGYTILDKIDTAFKCSCSKQRVEKALISVGKKELEDILEKDGMTSIHCHFCNTDYRFDSKELENIIEKI